LLIPNKVFYNKIELKHLKTFGCVYYFRDDTQHKSKFLPNAKKGIFLGFDDKKYIHT